MELHIFHLEARSAFHFGLRGVEMEATDDHAASDTLFGALCHTIQYVYGKSELDSTLEAFQHREPPFLCSGAFPYVNMDGDFLRFYPAPLHLRVQEIQSEASKKIRKARWVTETVFLNLLKPISEGYLEDLHYATEISALMSEDEYRTMVVTNPDPENRNKAKPWSVDNVPRVAIDRMSNASNIYYTGRLRFAPGNGLWCAFQTQDDNWIENLLVHLGEEGLGGERSAGYGQFTVHGTDNPPVFPDEGNYFVTLSHYNPLEDGSAVIDENVAYELSTRRGWLNGGNMRHRSVRMFTAGSVLKAQPGKSLYGGMVDVTPDLYVNGNTIWRYGFALPISMQL